MSNFALLDKRFQMPQVIDQSQFPDDNDDTIILRGCAMDSGTLTTDTEIVRLSHCGGFYYNDRYVRGCVQSCNDADACNSSPVIFTNVLLNFISISAPLLFF